MTTLKTVKFSVNKNHPDYVVAYGHCQQARVLKNGINSILRTNSFYRKSCNADLSITDDFGVSEEIRNGGIPISLSSLMRLKSIVEKKRNVNLPQKVAQSVVREVLGSWKSFFALRKRGMYAKIPGYTKSFSTAHYNPQAISKKYLKSGIVKPTGWSQGFAIPGFAKKVKSAKVVPVGDIFELHVLYESLGGNDYSPNSGLVASIDPGMNNLMTIAFSDFREGIIIDGKPLKKINSHWNHQISDLTSKLDVERKNISKKVNKGVKPKDENFIRVYRKESARLDRMWLKRNRQISHYSNTATSATVKALCSAGVEKVVIGWNKGIKSGINIGRRNNRNFVQIPLKSILDNLARKLGEAGIMVVFTEESYTSKASFIDNDIIPKRGDGKKRKFSGKRVQRGLYKSKNGTYINADLNGAFNIMRKHDQHFCYPGVDSSVKTAGIVGTSTVVCSVKRHSFNY